MKTIIIGLGNPVLGDDGVGWHVAEIVRQHLNDPELTGQQIDIEFLSLGGLGLMEHMIDYDRAILIDAINLEKDSLGTVYCYDLNELPNPGLGHTASSHDTTLQNALEVGKKLGAQLPAVVKLIAIESPYVFDFSEQLTPEMEDAVPHAAQAVINALKNENHTQQFQPPKLVREKEVNQL